MKIEMDPNYTHISVTKSMRSEIKDLMDPDETYTGFLSRMLRDAGYR